MKIQKQISNGEEGLLGQKRNTVKFLVQFLEMKLNIWIYNHVLLLIVWLTLLLEQNFRIIYFLMTSWCISNYCFS